MALVGDSTVYLEANSSVVFVNNHAYHYSGAIHYVDDYTEYFESAAEVSAFMELLTQKLHSQN